MQSAWAAFQKVDLLSGFRFLQQQSLFAGLSSAHFRSLLAGPSVFAVVEVPVVN